MNDDSPAPVLLESVRRIVVKVGSAVVAGRGRLRPRIIAQLAADVSAVRHRGCDVVLVSSGAVAAGAPALGLSPPARTVLERQTSASVGQPRLMAAYAAAFRRHRLTTAQLLLTSEDIEHRRRFLSGRHTLLTLLSAGIVPIVNENDALSTDENKVGDNDHLAALVSNLVSADLLVLFSSVPGLMADGGRGPVLESVELQSDVERHVGRERSAIGVGGMGAKISAARLAGRGGVPTVIADGTQPGLLPRIVAGERVGTLLIPAAARLNARKRWIAQQTRTAGAIRVDAGARRALVERGASLLPSGVIDVVGDFPMGARVDIRDEDDRVFAVGLVSYSAPDVRRLQGRRKAEIRSVLGFEYTREIVHRDDLVLLHAGGAH